MMSQNGIPKGSFRAASRWDQDQFDGANLRQFFGLDRGPLIEWDSFGFGKGSGGRLQLHLLFLFQFPQQLASLEELEMPGGAAPIQGLAQVIGQAASRVAFGRKATHLLKQLRRQLIPCNHAPPECTAAPSVSSTIS